MEFCTIAHMSVASSDERENDKAKQNAGDPGQWPIKSTEHRRKFSSEHLSADGDAADDTARNRGDHTQAKAEGKDRR
jgi:hypothetical protein